MKPSATTILAGGLLLIAVPVSCKGDPPVASEAGNQDEVNKRKNDMKGDRIKISIGAKTFAATLADNPTASAFKGLLPLNLKMSDLHGNEKFFHLPSRLPSDDANPGTVQAGDLMLWNSKSVVLFYKTFPTSYNYTRLGSIDNSDGLLAAVGEGDVTVKFELE